MIHFKPIQHIHELDLELVDQVQEKNDEFDASRYVNFLKVCLGSYGHAISHVYDDEDLLGFIWCEINVLEQSLFINTLSLFKKYKGNGFYLRRIIDHIKSLVKNSGLKKVQWSTDRPAFFEKEGFTKSKFIVLEYQIQGACDGQQ